MVEPKRTYAKPRINAPRTIPHSLYRSRNLAIMYCIGNGPAREHRTSTSSHATIRTKSWERVNIPRIDVAITGSASISTGKRP